MDDSPTANAAPSAEPARSGLDRDALQRGVVDNLICLQARYPAAATPHDWYMALAYTVRDRMLARWVDFAAITDPKTKFTFGDRAIVTGNPIRPQFKTIAPKTHQPPFTVLVFGGSQGAAAINARGARGRW